MPYTVEVRRDAEWISVGHPERDRKKAVEKLEAVLESGLYGRARLVADDGDLDVDCGS